MLIEINGIIFVGDMCEKKCGSKLLNGWLFIYYLSLFGWVFLCFFVFLLWSFVLVKCWFFGGFVMYCEEFNIL